MDSTGNWLGIGKNANNAMDLMNRTCPVPNCPIHPRQPVAPLDPACICNKPLLLYIPPGQHIHCPVHPDVVIHGSTITW